MCRGRLPHPLTIAAAMSHNRQAMSTISRHSWASINFDGPQLPNTARAHLCSQPRSGIAQRGQSARYRQLCCVASLAAFMLPLA